MLRYVPAFRVVFCPVFVETAPAAAQGGQVTGVVVDATGGVLPGARVTLIGGPDGPWPAVTAGAGLPPASARAR